MPWAATPVVSTDIPQTAFGSVTTILPLAEGDDLDHIWNPQKLV
jgi:hypothetical protein